MSDDNHWSRRSLLAAPAILALASGTAACAQAGRASQDEGSQGAGSQAAGSRTLIAYVTRSGNTQVIAGTLQRALAAELFEIRTARPRRTDRTTLHPGSRSGAANA